MHFILSLLLTGLIIAGASFIIPGVQVAGFGWAIVTGLVIGLVNGIVGGILRIFTFPLNWLTFGLVSFIITVLMIMLSSNIMGDKFQVDGFWSAFFFAIAVAVMEMILGGLVDKKD
ncbi:phage holin family protein [Sphingobacterium corticis]|uniref:Phage holin family protein n=1 Tax=Sphingobacterium corticis TaxID=1812823 RepID=A0ABW5NQD0_9SPHI